MMQKEEIKHRVAVVGLGPIGLILAVFFKEAGCDVIICDNDRIKINQIRNEGVRLENVYKKHSYFNRICTSVKELEPGEVDLLFVCLKTYHTPAMAEDAKHLNDGKLAVICAQNGIDSEHAIAKVFGEKNTLRMIVNFAGNLNAPNVVKVTFFSPPNYIASMDDSRVNIAEGITNLLNSVELTTKAVGSFEIIRRSWEKTILNASISPICGIGRLTMAEAMSIPDTAELIEQNIVECIEIAAAEKIIFPEDFVRRSMRYLRNGGNHFPSMAVDLMNGRPTEIDHFNGKFVEYGRKHYIRTSLNLSFTNMVKAMTYKSKLAYMPELSIQVNGQKKLADASIKPAVGDCFLGIDLGSSYTKFTLIDQENNIVFRHILPTLNRDKVAIKHVMSAITGEFPVKYTCATGYGRKTFPDSDIIKTEINCAAIGVNEFYHGAKNILDLGGEDIKIIHCDVSGRVENFYLNDKCAAGTGAFLVEIAERAGIEIKEMSTLARQSANDKELNSFCTVFAKTEIMKWMLDGASMDNIAKGIYLSIAQRIAKMRIRPELPFYMIGGVIAYHPYLRTILKEQLGVEVQILEQSQFVVSYGAAVLAKAGYKDVGVFYHGDTESTKNHREP